MESTRRHPHPDLVRGVIHLALPFDTELLGNTATVTKIDLTTSNEIVAICQRDSHKRRSRSSTSRSPTRRRTAWNGSPTAAGAAEPRLPAVAQQDLTHPLPRDPKAPGDHRQRRPLLTHPY